MPQQAVVIHERLGRWARQLRPRFAEVPIVWSETRSIGELVRASKSSSCPVILIDFDSRPLRGLEDLDSLIQDGPPALVAVIDPTDNPEVGRLARELGASVVLGGVVVPPVVEALFRRWLPLARQRSEAEGWSTSTGPDPEPWDDLGFDHHPDLS